MTVIVTISGGGLEKFDEAVRSLGSVAKAQRAYSMALNKTIKTVHTQVKRAISTQMGVTQAAVVKHGGLRIGRASVGNLAATINASGKYLPLKDFKPRQGGKGVTANPWNNSQLFDGTFMNRGRRARTGIGPIQRAKAGGHVFKNTGKLNKVSGRKNAIEALWGPSVPREMVRDESAKTFERISGTRMPLEIDRAVVALTKGVVSK